MSDDKFTYEKMMGWFKKSDYYKVKFVCALCKATIHYRQPLCSKCQHNVMWPSIKDNVVNLEVRL